MFKRDDEDSSLLGYHGMLTGKQLPKFRLIVVYILRVRQSKNVNVLP
jgi:hypothetical protein